MRLPNPAWIDKALTHGWDDLASHAARHTFTPASTLPVALRGRTGKIEVEELGCGNYGCVLETEDPDIVVKITTDPSEARFISIVLARGIQEDGVVRYYDIVRLPSEHKGMPVYAIWREAAEDVGHVFDVRYGIGIPKPDAADIDQFAAHLARFKAAADGVRLALSTRSVSRRDVWGLLDLAATRHAEAREHVYWNPETGVVAWDAPALLPFPRGYDWPLTIAVALVACEMSAQYMTGTDSGKLVGLALGSLLGQRMLLADVHANNIGRVLRDSDQYGAIVITDPGHMIPLDRELDRFPMPALAIPPYHRASP